MSLSFQHHHGAMLLKYSGISFISGAVNHGFFSGERSLWTALIGMVLFVIGAALEHRFTSDPDEPQANLMQALFIGALLSIGLGFFTGGLQHFPDSPARSAWVVPLGFFVSVLALALNGGVVWHRSSTVYTGALGLLVALSSYGAWQWLERNPQQGIGHSHADSADHAPGHASSDLLSMNVDRVIEIRMNDQMRFVPNDLSVRPGETVRFVVHNDGKTLHEMVLGSEADIQSHAKAMQSGSDHSHAHASGASVEVPPGQHKELVVRFDQAGTLQIACLVPGHYEAGMRGTLVVHDQGAPSPSQTKSDGQKGHAH